MSEFTPGPWNLRGACVSIPTGGPYSVSEVYCGTVANARLIAAAPDLLAIVERFVKLADLGIMRDRAGLQLSAMPIAEEARAAIRKATGSLVASEGS